MADEIELTYISLTIFDPENKPQNSSIQECHLS